VAVRRLLGSLHSKEIMTPVTLAQFLDLNWSDNVRHQLRVIADRDDIKHLVAVYVDKKLTASMFTDTPEEWPLNAVVWTKAPKVGLSKTMQAIQLIDDEGFTAYGAAKRLGISAAAITRAQQRRANKPICECCGQVIRAPSAPTASA
jgi:predicted DNA-binding protein (UPF0251 family)